MQTWLQNYPYRIAITGDLFLLAGVVALGIALLTVWYQAFSAARLHPVEVLRSE